jgi:hypothetical protein
MREVQEGGTLEEVLAVGLGLLQELVDVLGLPVPSRQDRFGELGG